MLHLYSTMLLAAIVGGGKQPKARPPPLSRQLPNGSSAARAVITIEIDTITRNIAPKGYHPKASDL